MEQDQIKVGTVEGTGATLQVECGFVPKYVKVLNIDDAGKMFASLEWFQGMANGSAFKHNSGSRAMSSAGLTLGSSSKKTIKIANTVIYTIAGAFYSKATAETAFTATTHDIAADSETVQEAVYLVSLNASGTVTITKGTTATGAGNAVVPDTPADNVAIGYARIAVAAGSTSFDATTDDLDAVHITDTYVNLYSLGDSAEVISSLGISEFAGSVAGMKLTGTVAATSGSATLTGTNTLFLTELKVGDTMKLYDGQEVIVSAIASATSLTITEAATASVTTAPACRLAGRSAGFLIGADADVNASGETIMYMASR